jgi:hypothetical protein
MSTRISAPARTEHLRRSRASALTVVGLVIALPLTACSGPAGKMAPLDAAIFDRFEKFLAQNDQLDWEKRQEDAIADCMKTQGFDYTPELTVSASVVPDDAPQQGTPEFAAEYGYGFVDAPGRAEESAETERLLAEQGTPQQDRIDAMSAAEKAAYDAALWGGGVAAGGEEAGDSADPEERGCRAIAEEKAGPDPASFLFTPEMEALDSAIWKIDDRLAEDPRLATVHEQWIACMDDAGLVGFTHPDDAPQSIITELNTNFSTVESQTPENPAYLALQQVERQTATADLACRAELDYDVQAQKVRESLEADFVTENQDLIEQALEQFEKVVEQTRGD